MEDREVYKIHFITFISQVYTDTTKACFEGSVELEDELELLEELEELDLCVSAGVASYRTR